jgi:hypothetical protein
VCAGHAAALPARGGLRRSISAAGLILTPEVIERGAGLGSARLGHRLGCEALDDVATIVRPDTILA